MVALIRMGGCGMVLDPVRVLTRSGGREIVPVTVLVVATATSSFD